LFLAIVLIAFAWLAATPDSARAQEQPVPPAPAAGDDEEEEIDPDLLLAVETEEQRALREHRERAEQEAARGVKPARVGQSPFVWLAPALVYAIAAFLGFYALLGMPLFAVMGATAALLYVASASSGGSSYDLKTIFDQMTAIVKNPLFVTIPLFILAGVVLAESRAPKRLVEVSEAAIGWMPGGVAIVAVLSCAIFTAFTGASGVTIVALGGLLYPLLRQARYPEGFTVGLLTTGGSLGLLFPPSLPVIVYAIYASAGQPPARTVEIDKLFAAALVPGVLLLVMIGAYASAMGLVRHVPREAFSFARLGRAARGAAFELPIPVFAIGGLYSGFLTTTDVAAAVAFYVLVVEIFIYRDVRIRDLPTVTRKAGELTGAVLLIVGMALGLMNFLVQEQVALKILGAVAEQMRERPFMFLLFLNLFLLVVGCLFDIYSAILVVVPLIVPLADKVGIDRYHLGVVFLTNLEIGYLTPPVGMNLFLSSLRFRKPVLEVALRALPFLLVLAVALAIITYVPALSDPTLPQRVARPAGYALLGIVAGGISVRIVRGRQRASGGARS
jgi:tripartite ATP-independent transporter DctM subunit